MSTSDIQNRESEEGDELVAYLDGELPSEDSRRVEERLATDADYRQQLRELDRAWEALDVLPRASVDEDFARTTIEMVAMAAQRDLADRTATAVQTSRTQRLRWILASVASLAVGYVGAMVLLPSQDKQLLRDLPVIRQVDVLNQVGDIDFLRSLAQRWTPDQLANDLQSLQQEVNAIGSASAPVGEAREWVQHLSNDEKHDLYAQQERFQGYSDEQKARLRNLAEQIAMDPDKTQLQELLVAYGQWIAAKPEHEKADLREEKSVDERIRRVDQLWQQEAPRLSAAEKQRLKDEIAEITEDYKDEMAAALEIPLPQGSVLQGLTVGWALANSETAAATRERLVARFDAQTRQFLEQRDRGWRDPLYRWIREALPLSLAARGRNPAALRQFFAHELSNEDRARLAAVPAGEFEAAVADQAIARELDERQREAINRFFLSRGRGRGWDSGRGRRGDDSSDDARRREGRRGGGRSERDRQESRRANEEQSEDNDRRQRNRNRTDDRGSKEGQSTPVEGQPTTPRQVRDNSAAADR
jgi:hypothetical protein